MVTYYDYQAETHLRATLHIDTSNQKESQVIIETMDGEEVQVISWDEWITRSIPF